jgi:hypothetical protein
MSCSYLYLGDIGEIGDTWRGHVPFTGLKKCCTDDDSNNCELRTANEQLVRSEKMREADSN